MHTHMTPKGGPHGPLKERPYCAPESIPYQLKLIKHWKEVRLHGNLRLLTTLPGSSLPRRPGHVADLKELENILAQHMYAEVRGLSPLHALVNTLVDRWLHELSFRKAGGRFTRTETFWHEEHKHAVYLLASARDPAKYLQHEEYTGVMYTQGELEVYAEELYLERRRKESAERIGGRLRSALQLLKRRWT